MPKCDASVMLLLLKVYRTVSLPACHCLIDNPLIKLFNIKKVRRKGTCIVSLVFCAILLMVIIGRGEGGG